MSHRLAGTLYTDVIRPQTGGEIQYHGDTTFVDAARFEAAPVFVNGYQSTEPSEETAVPALESYPARRVSGVRRGKINGGSGTFVSITPYPPGSYTNCCAVNLTAEIAIRSEDATEYEYYSGSYLFNISGDGSSCTLAAKIRETLSPAGNAWPTSLGFDTTDPYLSVDGLDAGKSYFWVCSYAWTIAAL